MEGYYWRIVDAASGRVVVALCGVQRRGGAPDRGLVAMATAEGVAWTQAAPVRAGHRALALEAGDALRASAGALRVDLGPDRRLDVRLAGGAWPLRLPGLGLAGLLPAMPQYWHPHTIGARARGVAEIDGERLAIDGLAYAEKNWGPAFPGAWWWGSAVDVDAAVAFAGGELRAGPLRTHATSVVVRAGGEVLRLCAPTALVTARVGDGHWQIRARRPGLLVEIEGRPGDAPPARLPVPPRTGDAPPGHVDQHLDGVIAVRVVRRGRTVLSRELAPAGLEAGADPGDSPTG
jgi:hypothetical protein